MDEKLIAEAKIFHFGSLSLTDEPVRSATHKAIEIAWFTGLDDYDAGIACLKEHYPNLKLISLSMGPDGSRVYYKDLFVEVPAFLQEGTIETAGAGDTFCASMLDGILQYGLENLDEDNLKWMLTRANAAASIVTTRKGALHVMSGEDEIEALMKTRL